jgi:MFS family permease
MNNTKKLGAKIGRELKQTFRSLRHRNFLVYSAGQLVSLSGTWMQSLALSWTTYNLTHSAWLLGLVAFCLNLPVLILSIFGGMAADKFNRRKIILATQWVQMVLSAVLALLVFTHTLQIWMLLVLSVLGGISTAFELPSRQAVIPDLVDQQDMVNAIGINSALFNTTRLIGPALAALLLARFGAAACFAVNALSYVAAIHTLRSVKIPRKQTVHNSNHSGAWQGLVISWKTREIRQIFVLTTITGLFGFQFMTLLPVLVDKVFHASASTMGLFSAASAMGALCASLLMSHRSEASSLKGIVSAASASLAFCLMGLALSHSLALSTVIMILIGASIAVELNGANALLQLRVDDRVRGRVMGIYTMLMLGAAPFGSLLIGHLTDLFGIQAGIAVCAVACALASMFYSTRRRSASSKDTRRLLR